jgi:hypothetical protein
MYHEVQDNSFCEILIRRVLTVFALKAGPNGSQRSPSVVSNDGAIAILEHETTQSYFPRTGSSVGSVWAIIQIHTESFNDEHRPMLELDCG